MFCDPLHKKLNGVRCKTVHFVSQTSFGWGLISACMFSKYFHTFAKWKKLCQYFIAKVQKLFSLSSSYWIFGEYFFLLFVLLPRKNFRDLISEGTFDEPLNWLSKLSVSSFLDGWRNQSYVTKITYESSCKKSIFRSDPFERDNDMWLNDFIYIYKNFFIF